MKNTLGHFGYLVEGIRDLNTLRPYSVRITADGETLDGDYLFGAVANSTSIAGMMKLEGEQVVLDDGRFELLLIPNPKNVLELHGSVYRNHCMKCGKFYDFKYMKESEGVPKCTCGGMIKPDVVLYEEGLDDYTIQESVRAISEAEVLIIGGTSLAVYPAAGLIDYFRGNHLVVINKAPTPRDKYADLLIKEPIGKVFSQIRI